MPSVCFQNHCSRSRCVRVRAVLIHCGSSHAPYTVAVKHLLALQKLHHPFTTVNKVFKALNSYPEIISHVYLGLKSNFCDKG